MDDRDPASLLIDELVGRLEPVRRVPSLAFALALVLGLFALSLGLALLVSDAKLAFLGADRAGALHLGITVGLAFAAVAAAAALYGSAIPGRQREAVVGAGLSLLAFSAASALCLGTLFATGDASAGVAAGVSVSCLLRACAAASLPALGLCFLLARGAVLQSWRSGALCGLGAALLGTLVAHLLCASTSAAHLLLSHVLVALVPAGLLGLAVGAWLSHRSRVG